MPRSLRALWVLLAVSWMAVAGAAPVPGLFAVIVPDADPQRAAQLAMRVVLVRLIGARDAADDPALAGVIGNARRYVELERNTTRGATQVVFDGPVLRAAVEAAGRAVWDPDRPLVWVLLPAQGAGATEDLRAQLNDAAQVRGLPIALVSADSAGGAVPDAADSAAVLAAARRAGAGAALLGQTSAANPQVLQWTLVAPIAEGHWVGGAAAAIDGATDALVRAARQIQGEPVADVECSIAGIADLASFTAVLGAVSSAPGVSDVTVESAVADELTLHLKVRGGAAALVHALASARLRAVGSSADGMQQFRYQAAP
ncbi:MAG TPA: DUF2066 domain-containing protein [Steroidobacteraceae bacterium]